MSEPDLITRAQQGDQAAWEALLGRYDAQLRRYLQARARRLDIDDLVSELWMRVVLRMPDYEDRGWPFSAWLYTIAHGLIIDEWRQQTRHPHVSIEPTHAAADGPEATIEQLDAAARVAALLGCLHGRQRRVVELRFLHDRTLDETAAALELSLGATKALQHRAIQRLTEEETGVIKVRRERPPKVRPSLAEC